MTDDWSEPPEAGPVAETGRSRLTRRDLAIAEPIPDFLTSDECLRVLASGPRQPLRDLLGLVVPKMTGIYALWYLEELLYVGISVKDPRQTTNGNAAGVQGRLRTYLDAWLTSDFTLAVTFRFIIPKLDHAQIDAMATGSLRIRDVRPMAKQWIDDNVRFTCAAAEASVARATESVARRSGIPPYSKPSFNGI